ncbi:TniB family NTP-binding protein [Aurantimonas sp. A2-1-M11]|uniref:TniB family NTP-binding protein n=1 Tax=Aurantimonas sp. A2-1-M11 TaxID=3113712 RepID=UPI002F92066B
MNFPPAIAAMLNSQDPAGSQSKQAFVKEIVVPHRKFKEAINAIAEVHNAVAPKAMVDAEFSLISGRSRAGKSTAVRYYAETFKSYETVTGMKSPVVYLEAPSECTVLSLLDAVLGALKVPQRGLRTRGDKTRAIIHHLREQEVQLLIVDEYQHFIDQRTNRFQYAAGNLLKSLLNTNACQMVFAGLLSSDSAITINSQAEGRLNANFADRERRFHSIVSADFRRS